MKNVLPYIYTLLLFVMLLLAAALTFFDLLYEAIVAFVLFVCFLVLGINIVGKSMEKQNSQ